MASIALEAKGTTVNGRGQSGYSLNVSAMLRDGRDGQWHRPPLTWATAIGKYIP